MKKPFHLKPPPPPQIPNPESQGNAAGKPKKGSSRGGNSDGGVSRIVTKERRREMSGCVGKVMSIVSGSFESCLTIVSLFETTFDPR